MAVQEGDKVPAATFKVMGADGPADRDQRRAFRRQDSGDFLGPGAFTPTCSAKHLPGSLKRLMT